MSSAAPPPPPPPTPPILGLLFDVGGVITHDPFPAVVAYGDEVAQRALSALEGTASGGTTPVTPLDQEAREARRFLRKAFFHAARYAADAPPTPSWFELLELGRCSRRECVEGMQRGLRLALQKAAENTSLRDTLPAGLVNEFVRHFSIDTALTLIETSSLRQELLQTLAAMKANPEIAARVRLGLLTNSWRPTVPLTIPASVYALFDSVTKSHVVGVRKPSSAAFEVAMEAMRSTAPRGSTMDIIYFDDLALNIDGAKKAGIQHAIRVHGPAATDDIVGELRRYLHAVGLKMPNVGPDRPTFHLAPLTNPSVLPMSQAPQRQQLTSAQVSSFLRCCHDRCPGRFPAFATQPPFTPPVLPPPLVVEYFKGGMSNPTFRVSTNVGCFVIRKQPPGKLLKGAHDVKREFTLFRHLHSCQPEGSSARQRVPVPNCLFFCDDAAVLGTPFYVMDYVDADVIRRPEQIRKGIAAIGSIWLSQLVFGAVDALVALHQVPLPKVWMDVAQSETAAASPPPTAFHPLLRIARTWRRQYDAANARLREAGKPAIESPAFLQLQDALADAIRKWLVPIAARGANLGRRITALCHGDFKIDNLMVTPVEVLQESRRVRRESSSAIPLRIEAVLDFELSHAGDPLTDLGYFLLAYSLPAPLGLNGAAGVPFFIGTRATSVALIVE